MLALKEILALRMRNGERSLLLKKLVREVDDVISLRKFESEIEEAFERIDEGQRAAVFD